MTTNSVVGLSRRNRQFLPNCYAVYWSALKGFLKNLNVKLLAEESSLSGFAAFHKDNLRQVAVIEWEEGDGIAEVINDELASLGYSPVLLRPDQHIPPGVRVVFTFGPNGKLLPFLRQLEDIPADVRPVSVFWNTEGIPDLHLPWPLIELLSKFRSGGERWLDKSPHQWVRNLTQKQLFNLALKRMMRFRYLGDLNYAYERGWVHLIGDTSSVYTQLRSQHGLPTLFIPWGVTQKWYENLNLKRDIDVLWMGKPASQRRRRILYQIQQQLKAHGVKMYIADNEQNPFIFGKTRTEYLNRAKITLNITRTWYDDNFMRFILAAPNRSLIVSETLLQHCPQFEAGIHYVAAPVDKVTETILTYLYDEKKRLQIVENAYQLVMTKLKLSQSMGTLMEAASQHLPVSETAQVTNVVSKSHSKKALSLSLPHE